MTHTDTGGGTETIESQQNVSGSAELYAKKKIILQLFSQILWLQWVKILVGMVILAFHFHWKKQNYDDDDDVIFAWDCTEQACYLMSGENDLWAWSSPKHRNAVFITLCLTTFYLSQQNSSSCDLNIACGYNIVISSVQIFQLIVQPLSVVETINPLLVKFKVAKAVKLIT